MGIDDFTVVSVLGQGGFGRVIILYFNKIHKLQYGIHLQYYTGV